VTTLVVKMAATSEATSAPADRARAMTGAMSRSSTPHLSTTPPTASAVMMSQIVLSMLAMPPRVTSWSMVAWPVPDV
jgi:hypothetical protein